MVAERVQRLLKLGWVKVARHHAPAQRTLQQHQPQLAGQYLYAGTSVDQPVSQCCDQKARCTTSAPAYATELDTYRQADMGIGKSTCRMMMALLVCKLKPASAAAAVQGRGWPLWPASRDSSLACQKRRGKQRPRVPPAHLLVHRHQVPELLRGHAWRRRHRRADALQQCLGALQ